MIKSKTQIREELEAFLAKGNQVCALPVETPSEIAQKRRARAYAEITQRDGEMGGTERDQHGRMRGAW